MNEFEKNVTEVLQQVRGTLQADGGDLEIVGFEGKTVYLRLRGACGGCPHAMATLKGYIAQFLRAQIDPEIVVERAL